MKYDIKGIPLKEVIRAFYEEAIPVGMGMLHYRPGGISDEEIEKIIKSGGTAFGYKDEHTVVNLDYIAGRRVKTRIYDNDTLESFIDETSGNGTCEKIIKNLQAKYNKTIQ